MSERAEGRGRHAAVSDAAARGRAVSDTAVKVVPGVLAAFIAAFATTSISLLSAHGAMTPSGKTSWPSLALVVPIFLVSWAMLYAVGERVRVTYRLWTWIAAGAVITAALGLSLIGMLVRFSLGVGYRPGIPRVSALIESLVGALGLLLLLGAIDLCQRLEGSAARAIGQPSALGRMVRARTSGNWRLVIAAWIASGVLILVILLAARPRGGTAISATGTTTPLLVIGLVGLLAAALGSAGSRLERAESGIRLVLVVGTALGVLALTRDLAGAIATLGGGLGVFICTARARGQRVIIKAAVTGLAGFAVVAELIALIGGDALHYPDFHPIWFHQNGQYAPPSVSPRLPMLFGPGMAYRDIGPAGHGAAVLVVLGRETGIAGLLGVGVVIALLLTGLAVLAGRVRDRVLAPLAWGMVAVIAAQFLLAILMLVRWVALFGPGPPLLTGGIFSYAATMIAIGVVIGCATNRRQPQAD
jgi:cell division protein FtsW (lipid II flippase)